MASQDSTNSSADGALAGESQDPAVRRMQALIQEWEAVSDRRALFLSCYLMMTRNVLTAIQENEFHDSTWVDALLHRFAGYYFDALEAYQRDVQQAPPVWQMAHTAAIQAQGLPLQELLLGVNAHINYDLVLTLVDILQPEWDHLTDEQLALRYADHCRVNDVIGSTIDAVQDEVLEPVMPVMDIIDRLLGHLDEKLVSRLLTDWREQVWQNAIHLLQARDAHERDRYLRQVEDEALKLGRLIS
jgi:Family of unknown function (DUF5995)